MFFKIVLLVIILVLFYLLLDISIYKEEFSNEEKQKPRPKKTSILNFIAYPSIQPFCVNLISSKARYWSKLPQEYGKDLYLKYCCTGCYYKICRIISCSKNKNGLYKICKVSNKDITLLEDYYKNFISKNNNNKKLDFEFDEKKIKKVIGKPVLKIKVDNTYYPIQILKKKKDMDYKDVISTRVIKKKYKCKNIKKK